MREEMLSEAHQLLPVSCMPRRRSTARVELLPYMRESQPWPQRPARGDWGLQHPAKATPGEQAPAFYQREESAPHLWDSERHSLWVISAPLVHLAAMKGEASAPDTLLSSFPPSRPLHYEQVCTKSQTLQSSLYFSVHLGSGLWMASETARGGGASVKCPRLLWIWPTHPLF